MNVYIKTVGSATPRMSRGCPPKTEWMMPHSAVDARVCTAVRVPSTTHMKERNIAEQTMTSLKIIKIISATQKVSIHVFLSSCSPNDITGIAEAKNMYVVGAKILTNTNLTHKHVVLTC